jgi:PAS domain S-box-containing protein
VLTHNDKSSSLSASAAHANLSQEEIVTALLAQDSEHHNHLVRILLFIAITTLVVFIHQIFLVSNLITDWHSLVHYVLLAITVVLVIGTWFTWSSYRKLHGDQKVLLDAYAHYSQLSEITGESLRRSESLLESLFSASTDRILVVDSKNRIIKTNRVAEEWAGYDPIHREFSEVFPGCGSQGERRNELNLIEHTRTSQKVHYGRLLRGGADCSILLSVDTYPVKISDVSTDLVLAIARDVTEQTGHELAIRHREKMATLGVLVAGFAHDLGNPLASLSSELELLREEEQVPEKIRESLDTLNEYLDSIKRKLHDIVEFSHRPDENKQEVDARLAINHALKLTRYDPRAQHVRFNLAVDDDIPPVRMREDDLVLALVNLIVNAYDAMPNGGILSISVSMTPTGDILLTVTDSGVGMDAATLQQATRPLFTTKNTLGSHGAGLGLTMVEQLMNSAGGKLTLASKPGHGTSITFRLPQETYNNFSLKRKRNDR